MEARDLPSGGERVEGSKAMTIEPRRLMWAVAEVCWADPGGQPIRSRATIVDISTSGACIRLKDQIGVGSRLTIRWHREQFSAIARNCRADGQDYLLGVRRENASASETRPEKTSPAPSTAPSPSPASPAIRIAPNQGAPDSLPESAHETASPQKRIHAATERRRVEAMEHKPSRALDLAAPSRRRENAGLERKVMQPKPFFAKFWRRRQEVDAPTQVALKETPLNKPTTHAVEHVSDPPTHLLSYEDIYHAAGIMHPRSGYGIRKVVDMLNSERIRDLSKDIQKASVLMALDAAGASVEDLLHDATQRQQALNTYEDAQRKQLEEFEARKALENSQIEAEMQRVTAHYAERIQQNKDEVTQHKEALHNWQMAKQSETQRISEVIELCGKPAPATPAGTATTAAAAAK